MNKMMDKKKFDKLMGNILNGVSDEEKNELHQKSPSYRKFIKKSRKEKLK